MILVLIFFVKFSNALQFEVTFKSISVLHTITSVFPEVLDRGLPMYTHSPPVCFRAHVIGGEPITINRSQILTPSCY